MDNSVTFFRVRGIGIGANWTWLFVVAIVVWSLATVLFPRLLVVFAGTALVGDRSGLPGAVQGVLDYLARINLVVLLFNLVPALLLDGGLVLRAWLWHRWGEHARATRAATRVGQCFGILLIGFGLLGLFTAGSTGGLWVAFIGWFLVQAASAEAA